MKNVIILSLFFASMQVAQAAQHMKLPKGSRALSLITHGEIVDAGGVMPEPRRPGGPILEPMAYIDVRLSLDGCADSLGPVTFEKHYNEIDRIYDVYVTAYNIHNENSARIKCLVQPTAKIRLPMGIGFAAEGNYRLIMNTFFLKK